MRFGRPVFVNGIVGTPPEVRAHDVDSADVIEMVGWLGRQGYASAELDAILDFAKNDPPQGMTYVNHLAVLCLLTESAGRAAVVKIATMPKEHRQAQNELTAWAKETLAKHFQGKLPTKPRERDLAHRTQEKLHAMFPRASDPKINGAVLIGVRMTETGFEIDVDTLVSCMFHDDPYERS